MSEENNSKPFAYKLGQEVKVGCSGEKGKVIGRAEYTTGENQYQLRYAQANGIGVEAWWGESALQMV